MERIFNIICNPYCCGDHLIWRSIVGYFIFFLIVKRQPSYSISRTFASHLLPFTNWEKKNMFICWGSLFYSNHHLEVLNSTILNNSILIWSLAWLHAFEFFHFIKSDMILMARYPVLLCSISLLIAATNFHFEYNSSIVSFSRSFCET